MDWRSARRRRALRQSICERFRRTEPCFSVFKIGSVCFIALRLETLREIIILSSLSSRGPFWTKLDPVHQGNRMSQKVWELFGFCEELVRTCSTRIIILSSLSSKETGRFWTKLNPVHRGNRILSSLSSTNVSVLYTKVWFELQRLQKVAQTAFSPPASERNGLAKRAPKARASPIHFASGFDAPSPASRCSTLVSVCFAGASFLFERHMS